MSKFIGNYYLSPHKNMYVKVLKKVNRPDRNPLITLEIWISNEGTGGRSVSVCYYTEEVLESWTQISKQKFDSAFMAVSEYLIHLKDVTNAAIPAYKITAEPDKPISEEEHKELLATLKKLIEGCGGGRSAVSPLDAFAEKHPDLHITYDYALPDGSDIWGWHHEESTHIMTRP